MTLLQTLTGATSQKTPAGNHRKLCYNRTTEFNEQIAATNESLPQPPEIAMPYHPLYAARIAAGLCLTCGAVRTGPGSTTVRCAACNAEHKRRRVARRRELRAAETSAQALARTERDAVGKRRDYDALKARGLCTQCRNPRLPEDIRRGVLRCTRCRYKAKLYAEARRHAHYEKSMWRGLRGGKPLPIGRHVTVGVVRQFVVQIDTGTLIAVRKLKASDRETRQKRSPGVPVEWAFQLSRIVREAVRFWADKTACPTRSPFYRQMIETRIGFGADARTVAAIRRHAPARGGNISATVCDMLVAIAARPTIPPRAVLIARRDLAAEPDPWEEE